MREKAFKDNSIKKPHSGIFGIRSRRGKVSFKEEDLSELGKMAEYFLKKKNVSKRGGRRP